MGEIRAQVDLVDGPGAWDGSEVAEAEVAGNDIERVNAQFDDAGAGCGIGEGVDKLDRSFAMVVDLEELRRRQSRGQDLAVGPNGEVFQPSSGRELVEDFDRERKGMFFEGWRRQGGEYE